MRNEALSTLVNEFVEKVSALAESNVRDKIAALLTGVTPVKGATNGHAKRGPGRPRKVVEAAVVTPPKPKKERKPVNMRCRHEEDGKRCRASSKGPRFRFLCEKHVEAKPAKKKNGVTSKADLKKMEREVKALEKQVAAEEKD